MRELSEYLDDTIAYDHRHIYPSGNNDFDSSGRNSGGGADSSVSGLTVVQYYTQLMACMGGKRVIFKESSNFLRSRVEVRNRVPVRIISTHLYYLFGSLSAFSYNFFHLFYTTENQLSDYSEALRACLTESETFIHISGDKYYKLKPKFPYVYIDEYLQYIPKPSYNGVDSMDWADW